MIKIEHELYIPELTEQITEKSLLQQFQPIEVEPEPEVSRKMPYLKIAEISILIIHAAHIIH